MNGTAYEHDMTDEERALIRRATEVVERLPTIHEPDQSLLRCHEVARIVLAVVRYEFRNIEMTVVDGKFNHGDHSWIYWWRNGLRHRYRFILDTYCVLAYPPVQARLEMPLNPLDIYKQGSFRSDIRREIVDHYVKILTA